MEDGCAIVVFVCFIVFAFVSLSVGWLVCLFVLLLFGGLLVRLLSSDSR